MIWMWEKIVRFLVCGGVTGLFGVSLYLALYQYTYTALYTVFYCYGMVFSCCVGLLAASTTIKPKRRTEPQYIYYILYCSSQQSTTYVCTRRHDALAVPTTAMSYYYVTLTDYESEVCCCESCAWFCASVKANIRGVYKREKRLGEKNIKFPQCHTHIYIIISRSRLCDIKKGLAFCGLNLFMGLGTFLINSFQILR